MDPQRNSRTRLWLGLFVVGQFVMGAGLFIEHPEYTRFILAGITLGAVGAVVGLVVGGGIIACRHLRA